MGGFRIFFFQAEDGIRDYKVTGVQTCALPISIGALAVEVVDDIELDLVLPGIVCPQQQIPGRRAGFRSATPGPAAHVAGPAASVYKPNPTDRDGREVAMQSVAVQHPHLLIWREPPAWPFVWRGLLPLVALALTASFAAGPGGRHGGEGGGQGAGGGAPRAPGRWLVGVLGSGGGPLPPRCG